MSEGDTPNRRSANVPETKPNSPGLVGKLAGLLFVVCIPLFLIAASVTWAVNDAGLYRRGFEKYDIARYSGITDADLNRVGADLRRYLQFLGGTAAGGGSGVRHGAGTVQSAGSSPHAGR